MTTEKQVSTLLAVIGIVLIILAGFTPGSVPYDATWNLIAFAAGVILILIALVALVMKR
ncbi:MAG: hypothetical protein ACW99U_15080 [Candidatus Thorarchaeota archaeon]|jgi:uncharacterized membrane protein SirB2